MNYTLVFSAKHTNALIIDIFLRGYYGRLPCLVTVENDVSEWYLSEETLAQLAEEGYQNCFDEEFLPAFRKNAALAVQQVNKLLPMKEKIAAVTNAQFLNFFETFVETFSTFVRWYGLTEFFHFAKLEKELSDWAAQTHHERRHEVIADLLAGKEMPNVPDTLLRIIRFIREMQQLKWQMREAINQIYFGDSLFVGMLQRFEALTGRADFPLLTIGEVREVLEGKPVPPADTRMQLLAVYEDNGEWRFVTGEAAKAHSAKVKRPVNGVTVLSGTVASPGKAVGTARVYEFGVTHTFDTMQNGDILVASTTGPEFMVAIQRAAAIVTDEGGLMSHAAVVSRELKKPCVVGTKIATKVFKDGDKVEVDATKGVVRKL